MLRLGFDFCERFGREGSSTHLGCSIDCGVSGAGAGAGAIRVYVEVHRLCDVGILAPAHGERVSVLARRTTFWRGVLILLTVSASNDGHIARHSPSATIRGGGIEDVRLVHCSCSSLAAINVAQPCA